MAVSLTAPQRAALRLPVAMRCLIDLYLDSGRQSYWDDDQNAVIDGTLYYGAAGFATASPVSLGVDLGAEGIEINLDLTRLLNAVDDSSDPANILGQIEQENYQQRRVTLQYLILDPDTGAVILQLRRFTGVIDQIEMTEELNQDGPGRVILKMRCESLARRYGRRGGRRRTDPDQQEIWTGDTFFKWTSSTIATEKTLFWGRLPPTTQTQAPSHGVLYPGLPGFVLGVATGLGRHP